MFDDLSRAASRQGWGGFFDWASLSPTATAGLEAQSEAVRRAFHEVDAPSRVREETDALDALRDGVAALVGVSRQDHHVILGRSVAEFMSLLAHGTSVARESSVLLAEPLHDCVTLAWRSAAQSRGFTIEVVPASSPGRIDGETVASRLKSGAVGWLVLTHVDHLHGEIQPLEEIVKLAREEGVRVIADGAQAVARVPVDVSTIGPDIYIGSGRKALLAPMGTAFMVATSAATAAIRPLIWSTRSASLTSDNRIEIAPLPRRLEGNLPDLGALAALRAAIGQVTTATLVQLRDHVAGLIPLLVSGLGESRVAPHVHPSAANTGIVSFDLPAGVDGNSLQESLRAHGLIIAATRDRIRVSVHLANDVDDVAMLAREVARAIHRN